MQGLATPHSLSEPTLRFPLTLPLIIKSFGYTLFSFLKNKESSLPPSPPRTPSIYSILLVDTQSYQVLISGNVTLFGERVLANEIKLSLLSWHCPGLSKSALNAITSIVLRDREKRRGSSVARKWRLE